MVIVDLVGCHTYQLGWDCRSCRDRGVHCRAWDISCMTLSSQLQPPHLYAPPTCVPRSNRWADLSPQRNIIIFVCNRNAIRGNYCSVLGKRPWALKHTSQFWPAWVLTQDIISIHLYRSCYIDPLKWGTWALTQEWVLAWDTMVIHK